MAEGIVEGMPKDKVPAEHAASAASSPWMGHRTVAQSKRLAPETGIH